MRDRRREDWKTDLRGRHGLEDMVAAALAAHDGLTLRGRSTASYDQLDYQLTGPGGRQLQLELKAKHQGYVGWGDLRPEVAEADLFILDELALRHLVDAGRYGFLLIRDVPSARWVLWTLAELIVCSKVRVTRGLATPGKTKGKVLVDLSEAAVAVSSLGDALDLLVEDVARIDHQWGDIAPWPTRKAVS